MINDVGKKGGGELNPPGLLKCRIVYNLCINWYYHSINTLYINISEYCVMNDSLGYTLYNKRIINVQ